MGLRLTHGAAPATPGTGKSEVYTDSADKRVKAIDDAGVITILSQSASKENILINGGMEFAQRQAPGTLTTYSNTSGRTYGGDRWGLTNGSASVQWQRVDAAGAAETGLQARYYGKVKKITNAGKMIVSQAVCTDDTMPVRGRTVRLQVKMRYTVAASMTARLGLLYLTSAGTVDVIPATFVSAFGADGTDPTWGTNLTALAPVIAENGTISGLGVSCVLTSSWVRYSATFAVPSNCKNLVAVVWTNAGVAVNDELNLTEAGLYDGAGIVEWTPRLVSDEFLLCQRYYYKTFTIDLAPAQNVGVNTGEFPYTATRVGAVSQYAPGLRFPVRMRTSPQITSYNPAAANAEIRDTTAGADCSAFATASTEDMIRMVATGNAATAVGNLLEVHITADAEL